MGRGSGRASAAARPSDGRGRPDDLACSRAAFDTYARAHDGQTISSVPVNPGSEATIP